MLFHLQDPREKVCEDVVWQLNRACCFYPGCVMPTQTTHYLMATTLQSLILPKKQGQRSTQSNAFPTLLVCLQRGSQTVLGVPPPPPLFILRLSHLRPSECKKKRRENGRPLESHGPGLQRLVEVRAEAQGLQLGQSDPVQWLVPVPAQRQAPQAWPKRAESSWYGLLV